jgi:four helix bundle protein
MFLDLQHQNMIVFIVSKKLVVEIYKLIESFPASEKYGLCNQIKRAAISVHLNIAEGCARKSELERKRFYEIARSSLVEVDTAIGLAVDLKLIGTFKDPLISSLLVECFKLLSGLISSKRIPI